MKILISLLLLLAACFAVVVLGRGGSQSQEETKSQATVTLPGSAWQVTSLAGKNPLDDHPITFAFDAKGNISGDASCNHFGGPCIIIGSELRVAPLRSTRRACEPEIMRQEKRFLALLGTATAWRLDRDDLVITAPEGEIKAKQQAAESLSWP